MQSARGYALSCIADRRVLARDGRGIRSGAAAAHSRIRVALKLHLPPDDSPVTRNQRGTCFELYFRPANARMSGKQNRVLARDGRGIRSGAAAAHSRIRVALKLLEARCQSGNGQKPEVRNLFAHNELLQQFVDWIEEVAGNLSKGSASIELAGQAAFSRQCVAPMVVRRSRRLRP